ncbi:MAG: hypothetical protein EA374_02350 [Acholeplasmatales bacterium]|nr:MAG: hypothetical protein EA374_02350 [Acholeplasmatales bacterium]
MKRDQKFFNCSEKHEIEYLAKKFKEPKDVVIAKIKELCKAKIIRYSTHAQAEQALIDAGLHKK